MCNLFIIYYVVFALFGALITGIANLIKATVTAGIVDKRYFPALCVPSQTN